MPERHYNLAGTVYLTVEGSTETTVITFGDGPVEPPPPPPPPGDTTRPAVVSITPAHAAADVPTGVHPAVTFSEVMSPSAAAAVSLAQAVSGAPVPIEAQTSGVVVTLVPTVPLTAGVEYVVRVANTAKDLAGNALAAAVEARFKTKAAVVVDPPPPPTPTGLRARLVEDMGTGHEGNLDGVPDGWDWAHQPKHGGGWNDPSAEYNAAVAWGQVYSSQTPVAAVVEVGNIRMAILSKSSRQWTIVQESKPAGPLGIDGGYYRSDFGGNESQPGAQSTASGTLTGTPNPDWNLHFYPSQRVSINNPDIAGVCMWYDARLVPGSDARARYLAGAGGDYWMDLGNPFPGNTDIAIGKHRYLKVETWTTLTAHTLSAQDMVDYPLPPVVLAGGSAPTDPTPPPVTPPPTGVWAKPAGPAKVMWMGDSITASQAEDPGGIVTLPQRFAAAGVQIQLVGSITAQNGVKHEGRGAWCADDTGNRCTHTNGFHAGGLIQNAGGWVTAHKPDIVVLNIGSNDRYVQAGFNDPQIVEAIGKVLDVITAANPKTLVMVTGLKSWSEVAAGGTDNKELNRLLAAMVATRRAAGKFVAYFDAYKTVTVGTDFTGQYSIHPSSAGVSKMASGTFDAVKAVLDASPVAT